MPNAADWELLAGLLTGGKSFRHRTGLQRGDFHRFYDPTPEAEEIRAEKERILQGPEGGLHLLTSETGRTAFQEFAQLLGVPLDQAAVAPDLDATRELTLRIEPDFLLLGAPPRWELVWASVCFPTRWSLEGKRQQPLGEIHGVVPGLNEELGHKIAVFFDRLPPITMTAGG